MGKHWDFTQKYLKRILNVAQDRPYIYGPHIYIWHLGQILNLTSGPCLGCRLKSSAISAKPGPCLAHMLYASAGWMPAVPDICQIWAKFVCWLGKCVRYRDMDKLHAWERVREREIGLRSPRQSTFLKQHENTFLMLWKLGNPNLLACGRVLSCVAAFLERPAWSSRVLDGRSFVLRARAARMV